ncbi:MAG: ABC-2 family transporter protein [Patescibacteria group bacterium]|nr:ABC-2 family transporter protein [Patescibacteria group bacterium]
MKVSEISRKIVKHLRVYFVLMKASISTEMTYRLDFLSQISGSIIEILSYWVFIEIIFSKFDSIAGWGRFEVIAIFGAFTFTISLLKSVLLDNVRNIASKVPNGELDQYLAKPISPLFLISLENFHVFYLARCVIGIIFMYYGLSNTDFILDASIVPEMLYVIVLLSVIYYSILLSVFSISFWAGNISHGYWVFISLSEIAKIPMSAFHGAWKILFVYAVPFVLFGAVPVGLLLGRIPQNTLLIFTLIAVAWLFIGRVIWKSGLRSYTSGGG